MLATISVTSASREGTGSRLAHSLPRPATSFLIRDILGKCDSDLPSSDTDENTDVDARRLPKDGNSSENESEKAIVFSKSPIPVSNPHTLPTLCCRECINGRSTNDHKKRSLEGSESEPRTPDHSSCDDTVCARHSDIDQQSDSSDNEIKSRTDDSSLFPGLNLTDSQRQTNAKIYRVDRAPSSSPPTSPESTVAAGGGNFSKPSLESANDKQQFFPHQFKSTECGSDSWRKAVGHQSRLSTPVQHYHEHRDHLQRSVIDKLKAASLYNQQYFYSGLCAGAQNLIDLNYAFNLRASALGISQLALPLLSGYRGANGNNELSLNLSKQLQKSETKRFESPRFEPYQRYRLLDWPQSAGPKDTHRMSKNSLLTTGLAKDPSVVYSSSPKSQLSPSVHPPSPTYSDQSQSSPLPDKRSIQLPAYFRSSLGGSTAISEKHGDGKAKKCRRSRTVFTELQMLGLEKRFEKQQYLSTPDRVELAELLGLSQLQVKTWYQNRRMKWKKQVMQGGGTEPPTKPKGRPRKVRPGEHAEISNSISNATRNNNLPTAALDLRACVMNSLGGSVKPVPLS